MIGHTSPIEPYDWWTIVPRCINSMIGDGDATTSSGSIKMSSALSDFIEIKKKDLSSCRNGPDPVKWPDFRVFPPNPTIWGGTGETVRTMFLFTMVVFWVPELFWSRFVPKVPCPSCRSTTTKAGGWNTDRNVVGTTSLYWIISRRYNCLGCCTTFVGHDPRVLSLLPPIVASQFPIRLSEVGGIDSALLNAVTLCAAEDSAVATAEARRRVASDEGVDEDGGGGHGAGIRNRGAAARARDGSPGPTSPIPGVSNTTSADNKRAGSDRLSPDRISTPTDGGGGWLEGRGEAGLGNVKIAPRPPPQQPQEQQKQKQRTHQKYIEKQLEQQLQIVRHQNENHLRQQQKERQQREQRQKEQQLKHQQEQAQQRENQQRQYDEARQKTEEDVEQQKQQQQKQQQQKKQQQQQKQQQNPQSHIENQPIQLQQEQQKLKPQRQEQLQKEMKQKGMKQQQQLSGARQKAEEEAEQQKLQQERHQQRKKQKRQQQQQQLQPYFIPRPLPPPHAATAWFWSPPPHPGWQHPPWTLSSSSSSSSGGGGGRGGGGWPVPPAGVVGTGDPPPPPPITTDDGVRPLDSSCAAPQPGTADFYHTAAAGQQAAADGVHPKLPQVRAAEARTQSGEVRW